MQLAVDVLNHVALHGTAAPPEKLLMLRQARPDLSEVADADLACEIVKSELAKHKDSQTKSTGQ
jgi:hypothetical protein